MESSRGTDESTVSQREPSQFAVKKVVCRTPLLLGELVKPVRLIIIADAIKQEGEGGFAM